MVGKSKKIVKKYDSVKKKNKVNIDKEEKENEDDSGLSLDDAFGDDEDVEYGKSKPFKAKKKGNLEEDEDGMDDEDIEGEIGEIEREVGGRDEAREITIKASKPISKIKKGDKIKIDGNEYEVDGHFIMMNHKATKEMAIELFDKNDKDYQLRYFDDQVESTLELYELHEIMYFKKNMYRIEW